MLRALLDTVLRNWRAPRAVSVNADSSPRLHPVQFAVDWLTLLTVLRESSSDNARLRLAVWFAKI